MPSPTRGTPKSVNVGRDIAKLTGTQATEQTPPWDGRGTALKPGFEPIVLGRKPLVGTVAGNVLRHGTGALNIDATRVIDDASTADSRLTGRRPTNALLDASAAEDLDEASDRASRFFWVAKPHAKEKATGTGTKHPTVKPLTLMRYIVNLIAPPGGLVLEPFAGSGTTAEACMMESRHVIAIEKDPAHIDLIRFRIDRQSTHLDEGSATYYPDRLF